MANRWTKSSWLLALLAAAFCVALVAYACRGMLRNGVNRANYERIRVGMTQAEVEALMGEIGVDLPWLGLEDIVFDERPALLLRSAPTKGQYWQSGKHQLAVYYDARGHVVSKYYKRQQNLEWFQRFLDWLGV